MNLINHLLERRSKYILIAVALAFAWQIASVISASLQLLSGKSAAQQVLFITPEYKENLAGETAWGWSNYNNLYAKIETNAAPTINLKITLLGILSSGENGFAMMKVNNGKEKLYKTGDAISGKVKLASIDIDSVTLADGITEKVYNLHNKKSNIFLKTVAVKKSNLITGSKSNIPTRKRISLASLPQEKRSKIVEFEERIKANPLATFNDLDVNAISKNGKVYGYKVNYKIDPALLLSIGLLPTDIVISVNDIPTVDIASDTAVANKLWGEDNFVIIYERNGVQNTLNLRR